MPDVVTREIELPVDTERAWEALIESDWLAEEVTLELTPGGEATFRDGDEVRTGWVEEVSPHRRLAFWWGAEDEPASRVELTLEPLDPTTTLVRIEEARPLDQLDLIGTPLGGWGSPAGERGYGPAMLAGAGR